MMKSLCNWMVCAALAGLVAAAAAQGEDAAAAADVRAVRAVIEAQLDAFARDDAGLAFSYAAPSIQAMFGNPVNFMRMVRTGYPVVYRPASTLFLKPEMRGGGVLQTVLQTVQMTDDAGQIWMAHYRMERQQDKTWRISGCQVEKSEKREKSDGRVT